MFQHSETLSGKTVSPRMKHYSRIPLTVLEDNSLSPNAKLVYAVLAARTFQGNVSKIGMRLVGKVLRISAATVLRRIRELEKAGHLKASRDQRGKRAFYYLTSPVFGQKQGEVDEVAYGPSGGRRFVSVARRRA